MTCRTNKKTKDRSIKIKTPLSYMRTLPTNNDVYERRLYLQNVNIGKKKRYFLSIIAKEIEESWKMQDVPVQKWSQIYTKLNRDKVSQSNELFDCLPKNPIWKTEEDKTYYYQQFHKLGGFCTSKIVSFKIHPSKICRYHTDNVPNISNAEDTSETFDELDVEKYETLTRKVNMKFAEQLKETANLSYSQTLSVMKFYSENCYTINDIPKPPSRGHLWKMTQERNVRYTWDPKFLDESHVMYFDMKNYPNLYGEKREIICVCIDNKLVRFAELENKKAATISNFLLRIIDTFKISTIVSDTEPTITGRINGVIKQIQKEHGNIKYEPCRLHILDLILKNEFAALFHEKTTGPFLPYTFVEEVRGKWNLLRKNYMSENYEDNQKNFNLPENDKRRDDYRYLLELVKALHNWREDKRKIYVKIPGRPISISLARWNSRAIYSLMAELFLDKGEENLKKINDFITYQWAPVWFGVRDCTDWRLMTDVCLKNRNILFKYNLQNQVEENPPTNEYAERIFRMANEKIGRCKSIKSLEKTLIRYVNETNKLN